jgi:hypothetical protein
MLTHDELWAGVDVKIENAQFHLDAMSRVLQPPERAAGYTVVEGMGTVISDNWHRAFYAHFDAFLSATRSVPEIIRCCFGRDTGARIMKEWYEARTADEQERRSEFQEKFGLDYDAFRTLPLSTARNISEHRTGAGDRALWRRIHRGSHQAYPHVGDARNGTGIRLVGKSHAGSTNVDRLQHRRRAIVPDLSRLSRPRAGSG